MAVSRKQKWHSLYNDCLLPENRDLDSDLGLGEWINSALSPATGATDDYRLLTIGHHKPPKVSGSTGTVKKAAASAAASLSSLKNEFTSELLAKEPQDLQTAWNNFLKDYAVLQEQLARDAPEQKQIKLVLSDIQALLTVCDCAPESSLKTKITQLTKCLQDLQAALKSMQPAPSDPPIDSISHQIIFIVTANANVTPSWTLVNFKGPGAASGSFASTSETDTHTLTISMGPAGSPDVSNQKNNLSLTAGIANALRVAPQ